MRRVVLMPHFYDKVMETPIMTAWLICFEVSLYFRILGVKIPGVIFF